MLQVKTRLGTSGIHGTGVFAAEPIPAGAPVWAFDLVVDRAFPREDVRDLPPSVQEWMDVYTYVDLETGEAILCGDAARFMNHSDAPNTRGVQNGVRYGLSVAARDIAAGEELTCDYFEFDAEAALKLGLAGARADA